MHARRAAAQGASALAYRRWGRGCTLPPRNVPTSTSIEPITSLVLGAPSARRDELVAGMEQEGPVSCQEHAGAPEGETDLLTVVADGAQRLGPLLDAIASERAFTGVPLIAYCQSTPGHEHARIDVALSQLPSQRSLHRILTLLVKNARLERAIVHERKEAALMLELTQALASSLDLREILYTVVQRIAEVVRVDRASIVLAPEPGQLDVGYVAVTSDDERLSNLRLDLANYPEIQRVLETGEALTILDASTHQLLDPVEDEVRRALTALHLFPVTWEEQVVGVVFLRGTDRRELTERERTICRMIANTTAIALRNARALRTLRDQTQRVIFARFEAEQKLNQIRQYAELFSSAGEGIAAADRRGRVLFANPRAHEIVGRPPDTLHGVELRSLVAPSEIVTIEDLWEGFLAGEYPRNVDLELPLPVGSVIVSASFASLSEGNVLITFQDVTEQRRTEAEFVKTMEFLESLVEASVDGIIAADMGGKLILFNAAAERILGYRAQEAIGQLVTTDIYPDEGAREIMRRVRSRDYGGEGRLEPMETTVLSKSGERIPIRISAAMIYDRGEPVATFGIFTDLRERIRVERRLAEAQQRLEVSEKQALLAELAGTAAHELNQPLTSVMAYAELLRRKLTEGSVEARAAEVLVREADRMADIVRKIGKMTKYETKDYVGSQRILDLEKASADDE